MAKLIYYSARYGTRIGVQVIRDEAVGYSTWAELHVLQAHPLLDAEAQLPLEELCRRYKFRTRVPYRKG